MTTTPDTVADTVTDYTPSASYRPRGWTLGAVDVAVVREAPATTRPSWVGPCGRTVVYRSLIDDRRYTVAVLINGYAFMACAPKLARDVKAAALAVSEVMAEPGANAATSETVDRIAAALVAAGFEPGR
jgi:hypothetical protein